MHSAAKTAEGVSMLPDAISLMQRACRMLRHLPESAGKEGQEQCENVKLQILADMAPLTLTVYGPGCNPTP